MKKIFIYYSLTGNGDIVANYLSKKDMDIQKIRVKKSLPKNKFLQIFIGGYRAMSGYKDELIDFDNNINKYDYVIIGSPIWNDRLSTPVVSALEKLDLKDKKITFILYSGSGTSNVAKEFIKDNYGKVNIIELKSPKKDLIELEKVVL